MSISVYLTLKEVVERYRNQVSEGTLRNWRSKRIGPSFIKIGASTAPLALVTPERAPAPSDVALWGQPAAGSGSEPREPLHLRPGDRPGALGNPF